MKPNAFGQKPGTEAAKVVETKQLSESEKLVLNALYMDRLSQQFTRRIDEQADQFKSLLDT